MYRYVELNKYSEGASGRSGRCLVPPFADSRTVGGSVTFLIEIAKELASVLGNARRQCIDLVAREGAP
jgi:threonine dehydratase